MKSSSPQPDKTIQLLEVLRTGEIDLVTEDPETIRRAQEARLNGLAKTFVYFDGEDMAKIDGKVTSTRQEEARFRFAVMADEAT